MTMRLSPEGLAFLSHEEGLKTAPYEDQAGKLTIGVGHLLTQEELDSGVIQLKGSPVPWRPNLTLQQVTDLLGQDCEAREQALSGLLLFPCGQNQFDALFSLIFNIGLPAFAASKLLRALNGGDWTDLEASWLAWRFAGGKPILLERRQREYTLFQTQDSTS